MFKIYIGSWNVNFAWLYSMTIIIKFCKLLFKLTVRFLFVQWTAGIWLDLFFLLRLASQHTVVLVQASPLEINVYAFNCGILDWLKFSIWLWPIVSIVSIKVGLPLFFRSFRVQYLHLGWYLGFGQLWCLIKMSQCSSLSCTHTWLVLQWPYCMSTCLYVYLLEL